MWGPIIASLLSPLIKLFADWLIKWLEERLKIAAEELPPPETFGDGTRAVNLLFDGAMRKTPKRAVVRRMILRRMRESALANPESVMAGNFTLTREQADDLRDLGVVSAESE